MSTDSLIGHCVHAANPLHQKPTNDGKDDQIEGKHHCITNAEVVE